MLIEGDGATVAALPLAGMHVAEIELRIADAQTAGAQGVTAIVQQAGFVQVEAPTPVVISLLAEAYRGSHANGWRLMDAYKKWNVEAWSTADLDLGEDDLRPLTTKKEDAFPPERQPGTPVRDVKELVVMLKREKLIA